MAASYSTAMRANLHKKEFVLSRVHLRNGLQLSQRKGRFLTKKYVSGPILDLTRERSE